MKRGSKIIIAVSIALVIWLMIAIIYHLWDDSSMWREAQWYYEFMLLAQVMFFILTPIFLMAIAIGVLRSEKKEEPEPVDPYYYDQHMSTRARYSHRAESRPEPRPQRQPEPRPRQRPEPEIRRVPPRPKPRPAPRPQYENVPEYEPSIYDEEIQCPACRRWISTDMPRCAFCRTKVSNFNRVRQVQKQYRSGQINKIQYDRALKNLKG
jgi:hypothetical protein